MLDWQLNPDHAPLFVGMHQGFFERQGLQLELIPPADPSDPAKFAAVGKVDLAITYEPRWILQQQRGLPLVWVATLVAQPLTVLITAEKIKQIADLRGLPVGYSVNSTNAFFLKTFLQQAHMTLQDVQAVNLHYNTVQALVAGRVMAITGGMRNVEPLELQQKHFAYHLFYPEQYGVPSFAELIFVTRPELTKDPRIKAFVLALQQSIAYLKANPEKTWQDFAQKNPELNDEMNHKIWLASVAYFDDTPGVWDAKQYDRLNNYLMLSQKPLLLER